MRKVLKNTAVFVGAALLLLALRVWLLPEPIRHLWAESLAHRYHTLTPAAEVLDLNQVVRTEYYRGFWHLGRTFGPTQSRALLLVLLDTSQYSAGETTAEFDQMLFYYDAAGRLLGYTALDVYTDNMALAATLPAPSPWQRSRYMLTRQGRLKLLRALQ